MFSCFFLSGFCVCLLLVLSCFSGLSLFFRLCLFRFLLLFSRFCLVGLVSGLSRFRLFVFVGLSRFRLFLALFSSFSAFRPACFKLVCFLFLSSSPSVACFCFHLLSSCFVLVFLFCSFFLFAKFWHSPLLAISYQPALIVNILPTLSVVIILPNKVRTKWSTLIDVRLLCKAFGRRR